MYVQFTKANIVTHIDKPEAKFPSKVQGQNPKKGKENLASGLSLKSYGPTTSDPHFDL